ncbi:zinc finger MYM-type protein 1-like protein, partial [Tanacetum coccineum]
GELDQTPSQFGPTRVVLNDIYLGRATDKLCKALQNKSQDIVNALTLVSTTKSLIQELRDDGDIIQSRHKKDNVTVEHHYRVDVFIVAIDSQLQELNNRFSESVSELLRLSATLDPRKSFNSYDICKLVTRYYPLDFTDQDKIELKLELQHYELDND